MAYCRISSESDVYLYAAGGSGDVIGEGDATVWVCCGCILVPGTDLTDAPADRPAVQLDSRAQAVEHLLVHRAAGHKVPERALERLRAEMLGGA